MIAIVAPFYLLSLGLNEFEIGAVIVISVGISTAFVYAFSYLKMRLKYRLYVLSIIFSLALLILYLFRGIIPFIVAILIGGITLSGRDLTPNQSIEQFTISQYEKEQKSKNIAFSTYNFSSYGSGALAAAVLFVFASVSYSTLFLVAFLLSLIQFAPYVAVSFPEAIERKASRKFDEKTKGTVKLLSGLFAMDSFGGGLVTTSMMTLWFKIVYNISLSTAGLMFIIVNVVTATSIILASLIANRMGLVRTMVYTHLISNVMLILIPVYHVLPVSQIFLYLRQTTSQMDVPARDSFINTIIDDEHRVRSNSVFIIVRNGLQIPGPALGGLLIELLPATLFYSAGIIKVAYDLLFFASFRGFKK